MATTVVLVIIFNLLPSASLLDLEYYHFNSPSPPQSGLPDQFVAMLSKLLQYLLNALLLGLSLFLFTRLLVLANSSAITNKPLFQMGHLMMEGDKIWMTHITDSWFYVAVSLVLVLASVVASTMYFTCYRGRTTNPRRWRSGGKVNRYLVVSSSKRKKKMKQYRSVESIEEDKSSLKKEDKVKTLEPPRKKRTTPRPKMKTEEMPVGDLK